MNDNIDEHGAAGDRFLEQAPLISALVSTYNAERFMAHLLTDLEQQTVAGKLEIIVVDSASPQAEGAIVRDFQKHFDNIRYVRTNGRENSHVALNRAWRMARGRYVTLANTDDRHRADAYEQLVGVLEQDPDAVLAYADVAVTDVENQTLQRGERLGYYRFPDFDRRLLFSVCYVGPQPLWRRELHERYGGFDESYASAGDYEFWLRLARAERFVHVPEVLGLYYLSGAGNEARDQARSFAESERARLTHWSAKWGDRPSLRGGFFVPDVLQDEVWRLQMEVLRAQAVFTGEEIAEQTRFIEGARTALSIQDYQGAQDALCACIDAYPGSPVPCVTLAELLRVRQAADEAELVLAVLVESLLTRAAAEVSGRSERGGDADARLVSLLGDQFRQQVATSCIRLGRHNIARNDDRAATRCFELATRMVPDHRDAWKHIAIAAERAGDLTRYQYAFEQIIAATRAGQAAG